MSAHEKAAWMLDTSEAAYETQCPSSVSTAEETSNDEPKDYATMRAQFALRGYVLTRSHGVPFGEITYIVKRWNSERAFKSLEALQQYLDEAMGAAF